MSKFTHTKDDPWTWTKAIHTDVENIVSLVDDNYSVEIDDIYTKSRTRLTFHLHKAILEMSYGINNQNISVAKDKLTKKVIAWAWIERGKFQVYANEESAVAEFAHVALDLPSRTKVTLIAQILEQWICWCEVNRIPVLCSTSIREDQTGFMKLHDQFGFKRRGSFAYRKIDV